MENNIDIKHKYYINSNNNSKIINGDINNKSDSSDGKHDNKEKNDSSSILI